MSNPHICYVTTLSTSIKAFFIPQLKYLVDNGFDVTVICSSDNSLSEKLGDKIHYIPVNIPRGISFIGTIKAVIHLTSVFAIIKPDIVQYSTPNASFCASIAAKLYRIQIRNYHIMGYRYLGSNGILRILLRLIEKRTCSNSTTIECVSKSNLELGIKDGLFSENKATVVWNGSTGGVDLNRFDYTKRREYRKEIRKILKIDDNEFVFGFVGRITKDKGINELLAAFSEIQGARLVIIGRIENEETLDPYLYEESLKSTHNIIYTGQVNEVEKYYCVIDALVLPSYREGFGNVVIEAASMGTPAIVSDIPGPIDAILQDITAFIVRPRNTGDLAIAMRKMMNTDYIQMGKNAHEYVVSHFDSDVLNKKILSRKRQLLSDIERANG